MTAADQLELEARKDRQAYLEQQLKEQRAEDQRRLDAATAKLEAAVKEIQALTDVCLV